MAQRVAYLVKAYSIPPKLFFNINQTCIHLTPTGGARTWDVKCLKHILAFGANDKRQITVLVSSTTTDNLINFQVIFIGATTKCLHVENVGWIECEQVGWHVKFL